MKTHSFTEPCNYYQINNIGNEDDEESIMAFNQMQMILHTTEDCSCCTTSNKYHQLQQEFRSNTKIERHFIAVNNCEKVRKKEAHIINFAIKI